MGCGIEETALHHLSCSKIPGSDLRSINRWMSHKNTAPPVQLAIISSLKAWIAADPIPLFLRNDQDTLERLTSLAHSEQSILGWNQAFKGRLSKKWTAAQSKWYDHMRHNHLPKNYMGSIWMKMLIGQLTFYNLNRWQIRNKAAHASESAEEYKSFTAASESAEEYENIRDIRALYRRVEAKMKH